MKNNELFVELEKWFNKVNNKEQNFWHQDKIAKIIKTKLLKWGNWRRRPKNWLDF